ncbi:hypothetical protein [Natronococcus roseus]
MVSTQAETEMEEQLGQVPSWIEVIEETGEIVDYIAEQETAAADD